MVEYTDMSDNTVIQIRRSNTNTAPTSLLEGELAYSFVSNVLYIGNTTNSVINIGGSFYVNQLDSANVSNSASTLVLRDANGSAQFSQLDILLSPVSDNQVATKLYVDSTIASNISLDTLTDVIVTGTNAEQNNRLLIGTANGVYITRDISGNVRISNTGIVTIGTGQVTGPMLANTLVGSKTFSNTINIGQDLSVGGNVQFSGNLQVSGNIVFTNATNVVVAYTYYNDSTDSIDTVFV
jgi:cytoskeletal protein CcmA (bactofilin family)